MSSAVKSLICRLHFYIRGNLVVQDIMLRHYVFSRILMICRANHAADCFSTFLLQQDIDLLISGDKNNHLAEFQQEGSAEKAEQV